MNYLYRFGSYIYHKIWTKEVQNKKHLDSKKQSKPKQKKTIPKTIRNQVWRKYCGNSLDGKCFSCNLSLAYECWEAGHIVAEAHGGQTIVENLRPICLACNRSMGKMNMYEFIKKYQMSGLENL